MPEPRRPGRPRLDPESDTPSVDVHLRLSAAQYDAVYAQATVDRTTVPETIRRLLPDARRPRTAD